MKKIKLVVKLCILTTLVVFTSCASSYKSLHPQIINYSGETIADSVKLLYRYDVMKESGNRKYVKKEKRNNTKIVAVKVVNNSSKTIDFKTDIKWLAGDKLVVPVPYDSLYDEFKQPVAAYVLYLLLTPIHKGSVNLNGPSDIFPFGFILGPVLAGWNMIVAAKANKNFRYDLEKYNICEQKIPPGETVYGLLGIEVDDYLPLTIKVTKRE
jgi:hypothetical protein